MANEKHKFTVYLVGRGTGCYASEYRRELMGSTWATSAAKAVSNIKYRMRKNGERLPDDLGDSEGMGFVHYELEAVAV